MDRLWSLLERRRLVARLVAGFAALLLAILLLGINSILAARDMSRQAAELYRMELMGISHIKEANIDLMSTGRTLRQMVLAPTFVDRDEARAQLEQAMLELEGEIAAARQSIFRDQEKLLLNEFELEFEHYKRNVDDAIALIHRSTDYQKKATAYISGEQFNQTGDSVDRLLHRMAAIKEEGARETAAAMARHSRDTQWLTLGLLLGGLLFGTTMAISIGRSIRQTAERLYYGIDNSAKGNVDDTIPTTGYRNELGAEEQSMAMNARQAELIRTEACGIVEHMPGGMLEVDERSAINSSGHAAKVCGEECARERFEPLDGPHIASIRRISILVVEDKESNQEVTAGLLANAGCKVTVAYSGQEALELLEKSSYDVVLMDMKMTANRINATLEIREIPAFDRLPIIAMTANGIQQDGERCLAAGMNGHIAKPIDPDELFRALMRWISADTQYANNHSIIASASRPPGESPNITLSPPGF
jgi:CheY-like chemotaxis protein